MKNRNKRGFGILELNRNITLLASHTCPISQMRNVYHFVNVMK